MYQVRSINLGSVALYSFLIFFILGLVFVLPMGCMGYLFSSLAPSLPPDQTGGQALNPDALMGFLGAGFILAMPFLYGIMGAVMNTLLALVYNLLSMKLGGLKIELEKVPDAQLPGTLPTLEGQSHDLPR